MKIFFRFFSRIFLFILFLFCFYFSFVNPNHWRIRGANFDQTESNSSRLKHVSSLFSDKLPHHLDINEPDFYSARSLTEKQLDGSVFITDSARFTSKYQIFYSAGRYPFRLEGYDAIFIPDGVTLNIKSPQIQDLQMHIVGHSPGAQGAVEVSSDDSANSLLSISDDFKQPNFFEKFIDRIAPGVFFADKIPNLSKWKKYTVDVGQNVAIKCRNAKYGCLVGDLNFYTKADSSGKKNFLLIVVDTMRWDAITDKNAPNLSKLSQQSVRFENAVAPGNMTAPSTNAMLSCKAAADIGKIAFAYAVKPEIRESYYQGNNRSFPELLLNAGYNSAMIGNISVISETFGIGINHGFKQQISIEVDPLDTPLIAREAINWLAKNRDSPFFLYLHFNGPHAPYRAPISDLISMSRGIKNDFRSYAEFLRWTYRGEIFYTDRYIGEILRALEKMNLDKDTTVVVTSDHGDQHVDRNFSENYFGRNFYGSYFDHGATLYNDEIRVPLIVRNPGSSRNHKVTRFVSTLDIGPTLLELAGVPVPDYCRGRSLFSQGDDSVILSEGFRGRSIIFEGRWKYIRSYEPTNKVIYRPDVWVREKTLFMVPEELFDLQNDPFETKNLVRTEKKLLIDARERYQQVYHVKEAFELVIDNPHGKEFRISLPKNVQISSREKSITIADGSDEIVVRGSVFGRTIIAIKGKLTEAPVVIFNNQRSLVLMTGQRLPLSGPPNALPLEIPGPSTLLPPNGHELAFLRRVEEDGQDVRHIVTGNPKFDAVLREWGYLNDQ